MREERTNSIHVGGRWAFMLIVCATFIPVFGSREFDPLAARSFVLYGLTTIFVLAGCSRPAFAGKELGDAAYFTFQAVLSGLILWVHPVPGFSAIMLMPLASQAVMTLRPRWSIAYCILLVGLSVAPVVQYGLRPSLQVVLGIGGAMIFTAVFSLAVLNAGRARERAEKLSSDLESANNRLRELAAQAGEAAATRERNRLAREIHDGLGHYLTVINVQLEAARALLPSDPEKAAEALKKAETLSRDALDDVRRSVGALRTEGAATSLQDSIAAMASASGLQLKMNVEGSPRPISQDARHALYRSAQEGITNVRRHSGSHAATVTVGYRDDGVVTLTVSDLGKGCPEGATGGHGLNGIRERIALLGGTMSVRNLVPAGFEMKVEVPA